MNEEVRRQTIFDPPAAVRHERDRVFPKLIEVMTGFSDDDLARPANDFGFDEQGKSLLAEMTAYYGDHLDEHRGDVQTLVAQGR